MKYQILFCADNSISFQNDDKNSKEICDPSEILCNGRIELHEETEEYHGSVYHGRRFYFVPDEQ